LCQCCPKHGATLTFHIVHINKPGQICPIYFGKYLSMLERGMIYQYKSYSFRYSWLQKNCFQRHLQRCVKVSPVYLISETKTTNNKTLHSTLCIEGTGIHRRSIVWCLYDSTACCCYKLLQFK